MSLRSGFFNSVDGDRKYDAKRFAEYFATFIGNGIFPNPANNFEVLSYEGMKVKVKPGKAWINGYIVINDTDYIFKIDPADGLLSRIDRLVLRYDTENREISLKILKGKFSNNPEAPKLQRNSDIYELSLADIKINKGIISIAQQNIIDTRLSKELCGIVHGTVKQVDTEILFKDYLDWINKKKIEFDKDLNNYKNNKHKEIDNTFIEFKKEYLNWFNNIKHILDDHIALKLLNKIEDHENSELPHKFKDGNKIYKWGLKAKDGTVALVYKEIN